MGQKCRTCGADFESKAADKPCPKPSPGREYIDAGKGNHVFNAGHDSDYFAGLCPCNDYPCKRSVAAKAKLDHEEKIRGQLIQAYRIHHKTWPQGDFLDDVIAIVRERIDADDLKRRYWENFDVEKAQANGH